MKAVTARQLQPAAQAAATAAAVKAGQAMRLRAAQRLQAAQWMTTIFRSNDPSIEAPSSQLRQCVAGFIFGSVRHAARKTARGR